MHSSPPEIRPDRKTRALLALSLILPLSLYAGFASRLIAADVGYQYDEALYVESAVFMLRGSGTPPFVHDSASWITLGSRSWPLMIISYVGATKAFVAAPLFILFGISAEVARYSGVLLGGLGIAGLVVLIGREVSPAAGLIAGVVFGIHPSYLDYTVFDNGGVSVWMAGMGLISLSLANHLRRRTMLSALLLGICSGLSVWGRANSVWLIASVIGAALLVFGRRAIPAKNHLAAMLIGGLLGSFPLIVYQVNSRLAMFQFMASRRQASAGRDDQWLRKLAELMISDGEQRLIWSGPVLTRWEMGIGAALLILVVLALFVRIGDGGTMIARWRRAFAVSAGLLTGIMVASRLGVRQHHLVAVLPLAVATLAIFSVEIVRRFRAAVPVLATIAAGLAVLWVSWDLRIDRGLRRTGGKRVWSSGLYDISSYLQSRPVPRDRLKLLDWGFQNNLYVISGGSVSGSELFWGATREHSARGISWTSEIRDGGSFLLFLSPLSAATEGFSEALADHSGPRREKLFFDRSGSPFAAIVEIAPTP